MMFRYFASKPEPAPSSPGCGAREAESSRPLFTSRGAGETRSDTIRDYYFLPVALCGIKRAY